MDVCALRGGSKEDNRGQSIIQLGRGGANPVTGFATIYPNMAINQI
jgi:hypothetical protein